MNKKTGITSLVCVALGCCTMFASISVGRNNVTAVLNNAPALISAPSEIINQQPAAAVPGGPAARNWVIQNSVEVQPNSTFASVAAVPGGPAARNGVIQNASAVAAFHGAPTARNGLIQSAN